MAQEQQAPGQAQQQPAQQVQVKISDEVLKGAYANTALIMHTTEEFILDFINFAPNSSAAIVSSRVIVSPGHMKRIVAAMQDNVKKYEAQFGEIKIPSAPEQQHGFGFRTE